LNLTDFISIEDKNKVFDLFIFTYNCFLELLIIF